LAVSHDALRRPARRLAARPRTLRTHVDDRPKFDDAISNGTTHRADHRQ
jgi:hypothetical protein